MRRTLVVLVATFALVAGLVGPSQAAQVTVQGNGSPDLSRMVVNNAKGAVVVKLFGGGGKNAVRWSLVDLRGTDGVTYRAMVGWYSGGTWVKSLERDGKLLTCGKYTYSWNATKKFWRVYVPRTCLGQLTNRIRARAEHNAGSPVPGETAWSPWVRRG